MTLPQITYYGITISISTYPKELEAGVSKSYLHTQVHRGIMHNSYSMEVTPMPTNR